jgi:opacity protein-like surface antigen
MMRFVRVVTALLVFLLAGAAVSRAQGTAFEPRWYAEFAVAATLGHKSDSSLGLELGMQMSPTIDVFIEAGHMGNVGTTDLEARAQTVATAIGGTVASTADKVNYLDIGLRYKFTPRNQWHPYAALGIGVARVSPEVLWVVDGVTTDAPPGVTLGNDLTDSLNKFLLMIGGGTTYRFGTRYFVDGSYRYGHIFPKTGAIENDVAIKTQRVQIAFGVRF